jgi:CTP synthase
MPDQKEYLEKNQYGGTIRLGAWPCELKKDSLLREIYGKSEISERHRHRYEFNNEYKDELSEAGLVFSGTSPDGKLAEAIELPQKVHPFFVGTQFHPEYKSRPLDPHPIFKSFIESVLAFNN